MVLREGQWNVMLTKHLTIGDIVRVKIGEVVPADMRIVKLNSFSLQINQSMLNGESV
jgi:P-type E1-E2 ATPase